MAGKASKPPSTGHTAGIFADMTLDGPEIGTLVVVVDRAKNLPNRKTIGKQDPYCAMRLGKDAKKTETDRRGGQTPKWDQELRFIVHESPDYYKLKVSIFNDDKKTDLIGEAFVSLSDLIKPGGGSNDLWHQLNYKGKYAGEIRIEMTYYDIRPREEKPAEKKRNRDRTTNSFGEAKSTQLDTPGPRTLGPREVRRRPLPESPAQPISPANNANPASEMLVKAQHHRNVPHRSSDIQDNFVEEPEDFIEYVPQSHDFHPDQRRLNAVPDQSSSEPNHAWDSPLPQHTSHTLRTSTNSTRSLPLAPASAQSYEHMDTWNTEGQQQTDHYSRRYSGMGDDNGFATTSDSLHQTAFSTPGAARLSDTNIRYQPAPAHQFEFQYEDYQDVNDENDVEDVPPPPPKHASDLRSGQPGHNASSAVIQPLRPTPLRPFIQDHSPLQQLERDFDPRLSHPSQKIQVADQPLYLPVTPAKPGARHMSNNELRGDNYASLVESADHDEVYHHGHQGTNADGYDGADDPTDFRSLGDPQQEMWQDHSRRPSRSVTFDCPPVLPDRPRSYDSHVPHIGGAHYESVQYSSGLYAQSMPQLPQTSANPTQRARPAERRISNQAPARKAISPGPYPEEAGGRRLSGIPFGPDAYDVLNPASSPVTNENTPFETPDQARRSLRLRDAQNAQELGPIIDNDGRVIDPSDHLPTSSWAPEPERKQRPPEHVIHYRTKNDGKTMGSAVNPPLSRRPNGQRTLAISPQTTLPGPARSSSDRSTLPQSVPVPDRVLPPVNHQDTRLTLTQRMPQAKHSARNSYHEGSGLHRPSPSEYGVPISSSGSRFVPASHPHTLAFQAHQQVPTPMSGGSGCQPGRYSDPLADELSMIDIGPSRGPRQVAKFVRGY